MWTADRVRALAAVAVIACVVTAIAFAAQRWVAFVRVAENHLQDLRVAALTPPSPQSKDIVVLTIGEETLARFPYRSPVDREFLSRLLRALEDKGVRLVALDMLFDQPSEADKDAALRETLATLRVPVIVARAARGDGLTERQLEFMDRFLVGIDTAAPVVHPDSRDGTVRAVLLRRRAAPQELGLAAAVARRLGAALPGGEALALRYRGRPEPGTPAFATYPAHAAPLLPRSWLAGKIVLVGADLGLADRHRTPFAATADAGSADMPGVLIHAHALAQILEGRQAPQAGAGLSLGLVLALSLIGAAVVSSNLSHGARAALLGLALVATWGGGFAVFRYGGPLLPLVSPTLALGLAAGLAYAWRWTEERAQKAFIRSAFAKFVAPSVVDHLLADPSRLRLGGERRETTFLFTDIAGYTTLSERTEPERFVAIMNDYMDGACEIALRHGGTIDKIVGDALEVMFNAPLDQDDHAERAVACALELDAYFESFAVRQRAGGIDFGLTRIGVNTGTAVVGNFGGNAHFDYTACGDAIIAAARLESVNKQLGTRICVSAATAARCPNTRFRPVGELVLKGKSESIEAFEPIADGDAGIDAYAEAFRLMKARDARAAEAFRALAERCPEDGLAGFHARRLAAGESGSLVVMKEK